MYKYKLWKVTSRKHREGQGERMLQEFPTLAEAKQHAKDNMKINKTVWKRNTQGDLFACVDDTEHYIIDEIYVSEEGK